MAIVDAGLTSLGVKLGYGVETTKGQKPASFVWLERADNIGGISLSTNQIDVSAIEDLVTRYKKGRQDTGGTWSVGFNVNDEVLTQLQTMITAFDGLTDGKKMWFEVWHEELTNGFFVVAQPPEHIPTPETAQNEKWTVTLEFIIEEYKGLLTAVEPAAAS